MPLVHPALPVLLPTFDRVARKEASAMPPLGTATLAPGASTHGPGDLVAPSVSATWAYIEWHIHRRRCLLHRSMCLFPSALRAVEGLLQSRLLLLGLRCHHKSLSHSSQLVRPAMWSWRLAPGSHAGCVELASQHLHACRCCCHGLLRLHLLRKHVRRRLRPKDRPPTYRLSEEDDIKYENNIL